MKIALIIVGAILVIAGLSHWLLLVEKGESSQEDYIAFVQTDIEREMYENDTVNGGSRQMYHNSTWGFEFEIPQGFEAKENTFQSLATVFNVTLFPEPPYVSATPIYVSVMPDSWYRDLISKKKVRNDDLQQKIVAERDAIFYESENMGQPMLMYIVPFNKEYWINIGAHSSHEKELKQVIDSFEIFSTTTSIMQ